MKPFTYLEPPTLPAVLEALSNGHGARVIAGGSDLLGELKEGIASCDTLVSLAALDPLRRIEATDAGLRIGALVTISELEHAPQLTRPYHLLAEAARSVATPEVRNQGTLGGNLCQRPRCLHYRSALVPCLKKGGSGCPAAESPYQTYLAVMAAQACHATNPSDLGPPLIALDAVARIEGPSGARELPLDTFFIGPEVDPTRETCLRPGELLSSVLLPPLAPAWRGVYTKGRERNAGDFAVVSLALGYALVDGRIDSPRVVLGGVAPTPMRSPEAERILEGEAPSPENANRAAGAALAAATPLSHNAYKLELARALLARTITRLAATLRR